MIARVNLDNVTSKNGEGVRMQDLFGQQRVQKRKRCLNAGTIRQNNPQKRKKFLNVDLFPY